MNGQNDNIYLNAALKYATKYDWAVFPVDSSTKKPFTPHGCKDAKKVTGAIKNWWKKWPDAAIGVATGSISGIIVIDLDIDKNKGLDGYREITKWEQVYGALPDTARSITGRGGNHLFFKYAGKDIKNRAGLLDGVDVRGEGGYVILPPSLHPNGTEYVWEQDPDETPIAEVNETVWKLFSMKNGKPGKGRKQDSFQVPTTIGMGERNDTIFRLACSLQSQGLPDEAIRASVKATNIVRCIPPLDDSEIDTLVDSALQYSKGELKQINSVGIEWHSPKLTMKKGKDGEDSNIPLNTIANLEEAIEFDEKLFGRILYNAMSCSINALGNLPWHTHKGYREWTDLDDSNLRSYLERNYLLSGERKTLDALSNVAWRHQFHPLKTLLEECQERWDGKQRIDDLLSNLLGAEKNPYNMAAMRLFMYGAISRCYYPGCKFDYVLILVGPQGKGKSAFLRYLAMSDKWFDDNFASLEGKDSFEKLRGMWILEMAELQATKKTKDVETIKSFITSRQDNFRSPYERRTTQRPRTCVLAGTTNVSSFLVDATGNRRFLPITCYDHEPTIDMFEDEDTIKAIMMQAWGEAMHDYQAESSKHGRVKLVLPKDLQEEATNQQYLYTEEDIEAEMVREFLDHKHIGEIICVQEIWQALFTNEYGEPKIPPRPKTNNLHEIIKNKMQDWKFIGQRRKSGFGRPRCYQKVASECDGV